MWMGSHLKRPLEVNRGSRLPVVNMDGFTQPWHMYSSWTRFQGVEMGAEGRQGDQ